MSVVRRLVGLRIMSEWTAARVAQWICFAAGPILMVIAIGAVTRVARTPWEVLMGVLMSSVAALVIVIMGMIVPLTVQGRD